MSEEEPEPTLLVCRWCVYHDRVEEEEAFRTRDRNDMDKHYLEEHGIDLKKSKKQARKIEDNPMRYGLINWEEKDKPLSKQLIYIRGNFPPIQLRAIDREQNDWINLFLPSFPVMLEDKSEVNIPVSVGETRYNVRFILTKSQSAELRPFYTLARGDHVACMECPMAFNKSFGYMKEFVSQKELESQKCTLYSKKEIYLLPKKSKKKVKKAKKVTKATSNQKEVIKMKYDIVKVITWFDQQIKLGRATNLCLQCLVRIEITEEQDPEELVALEKMHMGHVKFYWNAGHNPVHSRAVADFVRHIMMLNVMNTKALKIPTQCPKCGSAIISGSMACMNCTWKFDPVLK
jgi:hypothetical protein